MTVKNAMTTYYFLSPEIPRNPMNEYPPLKGIFGHRFHNFRSLTLFGGNFR